jgi:hypothetical protein
MALTIPASVKFRLLFSGFKQLGAWAGSKYNIYAMTRVLWTPDIKDKFNSVYNAALYNYVHLNNKPDFIVKLFCKNSVANAFKNIYSGNNNSSVIEALTTEINTSEEFSKYGIDVQKEFNQFKTEFHKTISKAITPTQAYIANKMAAPNIEEEQIVNALEKQVKSQIQKQQTTGKYIPGTFIELSSEKDNIRFFGHPVLHAQRYYELLERMDFRYFNIKLAEKKEKPFDIELNKIHNDLKYLKIDSYTESITRLKGHLSQKLQWIQGLDDRDSKFFRFRYKVQDNLGVLDYAAARILLITERAGQGKTNLVCDLSERFIQRKGIPHVFITGYEINSTDITASLLLRIFPLKECTDFNVFLNAISAYCIKSEKPFVIVIDGLNENTNPTQLALNLELFLQSIIEYKFIKVILTCRTEYFENNFSGISSGALAPYVKQIHSINEKFSDNDRNKLFDAYLKHFSITLKIISNHEKAVLTNNFLLLRVFSEVYKGCKDLEIHDIYKEDLYHKYFELKCAEISKQFQDSGSTIPALLNIRSFLLKVTQYMVDNKVYANVPLDQILTNGEDSSVYVKFLDENILIKRDPLSNENELFGQTEVVNYTFDEFRDYTITKYVLETYYGKDAKKFEAFLLNDLTEHTPILEGCSSFLFYFARKNNDLPLQKILQGLPWYDSAFINCIFSIENAQITANDVSYISDLLSRGIDMQHLLSVMIYLRYDTDVYNPLNINILYSWLLNSNEGDYKRFLNEFNDNQFSRKINHEKLISDIEKLLDEDIEVDRPALHNIFELLLYLLEISNDAEYLFERYYFKHPKKASEILKKVIGSSNPIISENVKNLMTYYDIVLK